MVFRADFLRGWRAEWSEGRRRREMRGRAILGARRQVNDSRNAEFFERLNTLLVRVRAAKKRIIHLCGVADTGNGYFFRKSRDRTVEMMRKSRTSRAKKLLARFQQEIM